MHDRAARRPQPTRLATTVIGRASSSTRRRRRATRGRGGPHGGRRGDRPCPLHRQPLSHHSLTTSPLPAPPPVGRCRQRRRPLGRWPRGAAARRSPSPSDHHRRGRRHGPHRKARTHPRPPRHPHGRRDAARRHHHLRLNISWWQLSGALLVVGAGAGAGAGFDLRLRARRRWPRPSRAASGSGQRHPTDRRRHRHRRP